MTTQVAAGRRIHRLTLTAPGADVPDGQGGWISSTVTLADPVYGEVVPASARDLESILAHDIPLALSVSIYLALGFVMGVFHYS